MRYKTGKIWYQLDWLALTLTTVADDGQVTVSNLNTTRQPSETITSAVVDELAISWSRPHPLGHMEPSTLTLTMIGHKLPQPISTKTRLKIVTSVGGQRVTLGTWWVTAVDEAKTPNRLTRWQFTCEDIIGRAAATKVGDSPYPYGSLADRLQRINRTATKFGLPSGLVSAPAKLATDTRIYARDVDHLPLLEIIEKTCPLLIVTHPAEDGQKIRLLDRPGYTVDVGHKQQWDGKLIPPRITQTNGETEILRLDASQVEAVPTTLDRASTIDAIKITYPLMAGVNERGEDTTETYRQPKPTFGGELSITSDEQKIPQVTATEWTYKALLAENQTPIELSTQQQTLIDLTPAQLACATDIARRTRWLGNIENLPDGEPIQLPIAQTIRIKRGKLRTAVKMFPARLAGVRPMRFDDIYVADNITDWGRFDYQENLRIDDLVNINQTKIGQ